MKKFLVIFICAAFAFSAFAQNPAVKKDYPADVPTKDRIMGAIMGVLIGDALGVGCHWYYDLEILKEDFGPWITDYVDPKPESKNRWVTVSKHRYDLGVRAGDVSQTGLLIIMLLESVAEKGTYDRNDFAARVDNFFKTIDGTNYQGRYTDVAMRETWANRNKGIGWDDPDVGSNAITSEAAQMGVILSALYYKDPERVAKEAFSNLSLFYNNDFTAGASVPYDLHVAGFISGVPLAEIKKYYGSINRGVLSQYAPYADSKSQIETGQTAWNPDLQLKKPHLVSQMYGAHCEIQQLLLAAYYLIHRYPDDFETAVLSAVNGGGNNMARAALTGGMSGAMVGLKGIPKRFIDGLKDSERLLKLAEKVADLAEKYEVAE